MVVVGADVHKRTHTFVGVDEAARELGHKTFPATTDGHRAAVRWAQATFGRELRWAVEDCRHLSARLEHHLLTDGQAVVRVPPKMMAEQRLQARTRGKSDPIDAAAVARAALREPDLPVASHDDTSRELKLLVDRSEDLVTTRTATINRLLLAGSSARPRPGRRPLGVAGHGQAPPDAARSSTRCPTVRRLLAELASRRARLTSIELTVKINDARATRISARRRPSCARRTLLALPGFGPLTAGKIVGEVAGVSRFQSEAAFARHSGVAPIPVWSGNTAGRVRCNPLGQPPAQRRDPPDSDHPDPPRRARPGATTARRSATAGSAPRWPCAASSAVLSASSTATSAPISRRLSPCSRQRLDIARNRTTVGYCVLRTTVGYCVLRTTVGYCVLRTTVGYCVLRTTVGYCVLRTTVGYCVLRTTVGYCVLRTTVGYCVLRTTVGYCVLRTTVGYCVLRTTVGYCVLSVSWWRSPLLRWLGPDHPVSGSSASLSPVGLAFMRFAVVWCEGPTGVT